jgi:excisionase family DNA binding protein
MTVEEAARCLGIGRTLAYRLAREGNFPVPIFRVGKLYRVPRVPLLQFLGIEAA